MTTKRTTGPLEKKKRRKSAVVRGVDITIIVITIIIVRKSPEGVGLVVLVTGLFSTNMRLHLKISFIMCIVWDVSRKCIKIDDHVGLILPE